MSRYRSPCPASVFLLDDLPEAFYAQLATAYFEQRAHHGPHHVAQEAVGLDGEYPRHFVQPVPTGLHDAAVVRLDVRVQLAEAGEVGVVEQRPGSFVHPVEVGHAEEAASVLTVERHLGRGHVVAVEARRGVKPGMGIGTHRPQAVDGDVGRQQAVQLVGHEGGVQRPRAVEVGHHEAGMYTGIGPAGSHHVDGLAEQGGEGAHQAFLHTHAVGLHLPAVVGRAVVGQVDEVSLYGITHYIYNRYRLRIGRQSYG